jgi:WXG100 family type VII secretion target
MAKVDVDPAELRRFAQDLNRFNTELRALMGSLHGRMRGLAETWRDQEQKKFADSFDQTAKSLTKFLDASQQHVQFLTKKAALAEEYLGRRS